MRIDLESLPHWSGAVPDLDNIEQADNNYDTQAKQNFIAIVTTALAKIDHISLDVVQYYL